MLTAKEIQAKTPAAGPARAAEAMKHHNVQEQAKAALMERLSKPSGLSDDEVVDKARIIIERAVENGLLSVQVLRFPNNLCTDNGRAINQHEAGWENTLTGIPKELYEFWKRQLQPRGYHIRYDIIDYPGGMPGDVGVTISWD